MSVDNWIVSYLGFLQYVVRRFPTRERAEQWARQAGVYDKATITEQKPTPCSVLDAGPL